MPQLTSGLRSILSNPFVYDTLQNLMGARKGRSEFVRKYITPVPGVRILDIGCGTGRILDHLPNVIYYGFDLSNDYINAAQRRYGSTGNFYCAAIEHNTLAKLEPFDIVIATGVLHHLGDEEAKSLFDLAYLSLKKGGRFITKDPCFSPEQNRIARFLVNQDRGQNVRTPDGYRHIATSVFPKPIGKIRHRTWVPYTHWIMECTKD